MNDNLIKKVKRRCYITDNDETINERVIDMIENSIPKVRRMMGISDEDYDFTEAGEEQELFLNYCYYVWNDSADSFKSNYLDDIMSIRSKYEVSQYVESKETN